MDLNPIKRLAVCETGSLVVIIERRTLIRESLTRKLLAAPTGDRGNGPCDGRRMVGEWISPSAPRPNCHRRGESDCEAELHRLVESSRHLLSRCSRIERSRTMSCGRWTPEQKGSFPSVQQLTWPSKRCGLSSPELYTSLPPRLSARAVQLKSQLAAVPPALRECSQASSDNHRSDQAGQGEQGNLLRAKHVRKHCKSACS